MLRGLVTRQCCFLHWREAASTFAYNVQQALIWS